MIETTASLIVDLGNSATRVITQIAKGTASGQKKIHSRFSEIPNRYAYLTSFDEVPEIYLDKVSDGFEDFDKTHVDSEDKTIIFQNGMGLFATGKYVDRERGRDVLRPSALEKKYDSLTTELAIRLALLEGYNAVADILNTYPANLDITWNVLVLIPPADIKQGSEKLTEKIKGITELEYLNPELKVTPTIDSVKVLAEGFASYLGVLFTPTGQARKDYMYLTQATTMIIDIGAGTTDYCLVKGIEPIEDMKDTVTIGGNNVVQAVRKNLRTQGITTTDEEIQEAVRTGFIKDGAKDVSIVAELNAAKEIVARDIVNSIRDYFEYSSIPARSVNYLLVVGGGSLNSVEGSKAISEFLVEFFKKLSPNVELVVNPGDKEGVAPKDSPVQLTARTLNVIGGSIAARREIMR